MSRKPGITSAKAKKILKDGTIRGKPLTKKQRAYFGLVAGGKTHSKKTKRVKQIKGKTKPSKKKATSKKKS